MGVVEAITASFHMGFSSAGYTQLVTGLRPAKMERIVRERSVSSLIPVSSFGYCLCIHKPMEPQM